MYVVDGLVVDGLVVDGLGVKGSKHVQNVAAHIASKLSSGRLGGLRTQLERISLRAARGLSKVLLFCGCSCLFACASVTDTSRLTATISDYNPDILSGVLLVGHEIPEDFVVLPTIEDILALTPEMQQFARAQFRGGRDDTEQAKRLLAAMINKQLFPIDFYNSKTLMASEVYTDRSGNCLSYTSLYIALARHIGIDARYQIARVAPSWTSDSGFLVRGRHINVVVRDNRAAPGEWITVDFNQIASDPSTPHRTVTDEFALSSFYNNIAVQHLYAGRTEESMHYMRAAIRAFPKNADIWTNLAVLYSSRGKRMTSIQAYEIALSIDLKHDSALNGLQQSYDLIGNTELSEHYRSILVERRKRDPYYHYALAQAAFDNGDYEASSHSIERALELNKRPAGFHYIRGLTHFKLEDYETALASLTKAQKKDHQLLPTQRVITNRLLEKLQNDLVIH